MTGLSLAQLDRARRDPEVFAELVVGQPLWPHQAEVVRSEARYRVICAGRRAGKTRVFGVLALHQGVSVARSKVLIVSAGEKSAKRMLKDIREMAAAAPLVASAIDDESTSMLLLTNGSTIECIAASMGAVRSAEADLLIVDEAGFVPQEIWEAAEPIVIARAGSRVLLSSTPWGSQEHFFRQLWHLGAAQPSEKIESWHWPSTVSPDVDQALLEWMAEGRSQDYIDREIFAIWGDASGAYLSSEDVDACVDQRPMLVPADCSRTVTALAGMDWGQARDASTLVALAIDEEATLREPHQRPVYRLVFLFEKYRTPYHEVIADVLEVGRGLLLGAIASECNGVGAMPTEELRRHLIAARRATTVVAVTTTSASKADAFGMIRMLLQQRRLLLPNHPALLKQLRSLQFENLPTGGVRIAVPEALGHDDLAMGLCLAVSLLVDGIRRETKRWERPRQIQLHDRGDHRAAAGRDDSLRQVTQQLASMGDPLAKKVLGSSPLRGRGLPTHGGRSWR